MWHQNTLGRVQALAIFIRHVMNPTTMAAMWKKHGDGFPLFGGEAYCSFALVKELIAREPEKLPGIIGPLNDAETYFSQGLLTFRQRGPNHAARRALMIERIEAARAQLPRLEELLGKEIDVNHAISRFLLETLGGIVPTDQEVADVAFFRDSGPALGIFPKWMRNTIFRSKNIRAVKVRKHLIDRFTNAGLPFADTFFDAIWFNAGTLHFYPKLAYDAVRNDKTLRDAVCAERDRAPGDRPATRALIMEIVRLKSRILSVNFFDEGRVKIAVIAAACRDPARFPNPERIDLTRDHRDSVSFALPAPTRSCPAMDLAPEAMACIVAHHAREDCRNRVDRQAAPSIIGQADHLEMVDRINQRKPM